MEDRLPLRPKKKQLRRCLVAQPKRKLHRRRTRVCFDMKATSRTLIGVNPVSLPDPDVSISKNIRQLSIPNVNSTILAGAAVNIGVPSEPQRLPPCIDPPLRGKQGDKEPAKTSEDPAPHPSQVVIAVDADKAPTPKFSEAQNLGSSVRPLPQKIPNAYAEVAGASISPETFEESHMVPGSSRLVVDDRSSTIPDESSSDSYKTSSSTKHPRKKNVCKEDIPDVIDLTVSWEDGNATKPNTSPEQRRVIVVDEDDKSVTKGVPSGSQGAPIDLISSPKESRPAKVLHPFFARQVVEKQRNNATRVPYPIASILKTMQVPWPVAENQHNMGPQTSFSSGSPAFGKYYKAPSPVTSPSPSYLHWLNTEAVPPLSFSGTHAGGVESHVPTPLKRETVVQSLPNAHREHPGISRLFNEPAGIMVPSAVENGEMWSQKWKPRRAAEVIGNEGNALYLKAWLQALALHAHDKWQLGGSGVKSTEESNIRRKRPMVVRAVKKRARKRRRLDSEDEFSAGDWMVDDEEVIEKECDFDDESLDWSSPRSMTRVNHPSLHRGRRPDVTDDPSFFAVDNDSWFPEFSTLTNTILLAGPPGSGKSSTIYACAEELGWEVFEVYPGIGKRSGGSLSSLIGDVGKNHHVGRRGASISDTKRSINPVS